MGSFPRIGSRQDRCPRCCRQHYCCYRQGLCNWLSSSGVSGPVRRIPGSCVLPPRPNPNLWQQQPITFAFFFIGAMLPYAFTAFTMKSVGVAANEMVKEVARQFRENPDLILEGTKEKPDYDQCIKISTESSLREMVLPGLLVILSPILTGILFGIEGVCGLLVGGLTSGVQ